jgi:hypothetical protein
MRRIDVPMDRRAPRVTGNLFHRERTRTSTAFNQHGNGSLATAIGRVTAHALLALATDERFINLHDSRSR